MHMHTEKKHLVAVCQLHALTEGPEEEEQGYKGYPANDAEVLAVKARRNNLNGRNR